MGGGQRARLVLLSRCQVPRHSLVAAVTSLRVTLHVQTVFCQAPFVGTENGCFTHVSCCVIFCGVFFCGQDDDDDEVRDRATLHLQTLRSLVEAGACLVYCDSA